jgi:hypothetical protein
MSQTKTEHIPMSKWGRDHWSTLGYIECMCVDNKGVPGRDQMRCDPDVHPGLAGRGTGTTGKKYPTRLKDGEEVYGHDDWSCAEDMEREGLLEWNGTGIHPVFKLTEKGQKLAAKLRQYKADGGNFSNFKVEI